MYQRRDTAAGRFMQLIAFLATLGLPYSVLAEEAAEKSWVVFDPSPKAPPKGKWCFSRIIVSEDKDRNISTQEVEICCAKDQLPTSNTDPTKASCIAWNQAPGRDLCTAEQVKAGEFEVCASKDKSWLACCPEGFVPNCETADDPNLARCVRPDKLPDVDKTTSLPTDEDTLLAELSASENAIMDTAPTDTQRLTDEYNYAALLVSELEQSSNSYESFLIAANRRDLPLNDGIEISLETDPTLYEIARIKGNSIEGCWDRVKRIIKFRVELGGSVLPHQAAAAAACCAANGEKGYFLNIPLFCAAIYGRDLTLQAYKSCIEYGISPTTADQCIFGISGYPRIGAFIKSINPSKAPITIGR